MELSRSQGQVMGYPPHYARRETCHILWHVLASAESLGSFLFCLLQIRSRILKEQVRRLAVLPTYKKMIRQVIRVSARPLLCFGCIAFFCSEAFSQSLSGNNPPGGTTDFPISVSVGTTNLCLSVAGSPTAFSHLLLRRGAAPSDTDFDFIAAQNGQANAINLEQPELQTTNYVLRVRTPTNSLTHNFTVTVATNQADLRAISRPATKPLISTNQGGLTIGAWHYFRVDIVTNISGWRLRLNSTNGTQPDLYVQRGQVPTTSAFLKRSQGQTNDVLVFSGNELTTGAYFVGVNSSASGTNSYTLTTELINFTTLNWDPGTTHLGTQVYTNLTPAGGDFYFKITTLNSSLGAWRTALNVSVGEANVYVNKGTPPTTVSFQYKSDRVGSDGFVIPSAAFNPGEDWYFLVHADPGAQWTLMTGEPYVTDLGTVASDSSSGSGQVPVGPEGIRFFKTVVPANIVAWRLWLAGSTNLTNSIMVKKLSLPLPGANELFQAGQMLVVPAYLVSGQLYFVGVVGNPGTTIDLDSRQHSFTDIPFETTTNITVTGYGYTSYRVQVPVDQIAWQVSVVVNSGDPNIAVRRNSVPNEGNNDAYSEVPGTVTDSITLVPPTLSDGTFYITVYGTNAHSFMLQSGTPAITEIDFVSTTTNTDTNRVGWRFFQVSDIGQQLGALGWDLYLTNHAPGTRIALRRNAVPSIWNFRNPNQGTAGNHDFLSVGDFLQRPGHQADVWYVGVYNPTNALGSFTLVTGELTAAPVSFDGGTASRTAVPTGKWQFFRVDVPANPLGWDIRLAIVTAGAPQLVVRREALPVSLTGIGFSPPVTATNWPTGNQWVAGKDWTERDSSSDGSVNESARILTMGTGRPLEPGTYYVGVIDSASSSNAMSYSVLSRGIGNGLSIPISDFPHAGGNVSSNGLSPREIAVYRTVVGTNVPNWKVKLTPTVGDALLAVSKDRLPNISAAINGSVTNALTAGKKMLKSGNEHLVLLPLAGKTNLIPGTYYFVVISEGIVAFTNRTRIGTGASGYTLQSLGTMPEIDLGLLVTNDIIRIDQLEGGESTAYHFHNVPETLGFEIYLENRIGNPTAVSRGDPPLADPGAQSSIGGIGSDSYGNEGGEVDALVASPSIITVADPFLVETIMVKARASGGDYPDASYTLRIKRLVPVPLAFDGGTMTVTDHTDIWRFFRVDVPANAQGWDFRILNVTAGSPQMVISRDVLGIQVQTFLITPGVSTSWPSGARWAAGADWTGRPLSASGVNEDGRILAMGMGRPLEPGTYYVGIRNPSSPSTTMSYTVQSRGIGTGFSIPVTDLPFAGGSVTNSAVAPREAAYYRVVIPPGVPNWRAKLTATSGEAMLVTLTNTVPSVLSGKSGSAGKLMQKPASEQYLLLPSNGGTNLGPATNYFAVISEGITNAAQAGRIGTGTSSFVLESRGELPIIDLGVAGGADLVQAGTLEAGEVKAYQFTIPAGITSLEARLENPTGSPAMVLRVGDRFPNPGSGSTVTSPGAVGADDYGTEGGYTITPTDGNANTTLINLINPTNSVYTLMVKARAVSGVYSNASYTVRIRAITFDNLAFDGGSLVVTNQDAGTWRYFRIDVPANAAGWDLRLKNVTAGLPRLVVRRDVLPGALTTSPWAVPGIITNWPSSNQWAAAGDWTRRATSVDGATLEDGRVLAMGMGQPLEPGTYYAGVINSQGTSPMSYTLFSRGIGNGFAIPITDLDFAGGTTNLSGLLPREAAYYRVVVPTNTPSWKVKLAPTSGEALLVLLKDRVPNVDSGYFGGLLAGKIMQKADDEYSLLLPSGTQTNLAAGTYYLAVVGEGVNPVPGRIGTDSSGFTISSLGTNPVVNLGTISASDLVRPDTLAGGESKFYQFTVPIGTLSFEARLENRAGNPVLVLRPDEKLPDPGSALAGVRDAYGNEGGVTSSDVNTSIITVPNPTNTIYTLAVKARISNNAYPDASYTLRVRRIPVPELNFTAEQNTNGLSNVGSGVLLDNQRAYYKVIVPTNVNGLPVIGWELDVAQSSGLANVRVRKDALPSDTVFAGTTVFTPASAIVVSPFLTNGTWYVEVRGNNSTAFSLTSSALALQRPAWSMPGIGEPVTTPGLSAPNFGDTGIATNGVALPADQGVDLEQGYYHFYAVNVPTNNGGLMRVQLEAISGNPDFYLRTNQPPTYTHRNDGLTGTLVDRSLTGTGTEYANWVPINGKAETQLAPGLWYMAVRALGNANARYRLKLSTGDVQNLTLNGGSVANQTVAGNDWRYYRLAIPEDAPVNWNVTFSQQSGDVVMHVRDTVPPGNGANNSGSEYKDWQTDAKNSGPYANYDLPGAFTFTVPPVRPGTIYYLGFRAKIDSIFAVTSTTSGGTNPALPTIEFYGGSVTNTLPPNAQLAYRIFAPADASRWKHTSIHSNVVQLYLDNGSLPTKTAADDWRSAGPNSSFNQYLGGWPWVPNVSYYLFVTNTSSLSQPFSFTMDGKSIATDDNDNDGMLDSWEYRYFGPGNLSQTPGGDFDGDGVTNYSEYVEGTNPADRNSLRPRLIVLATNGVVNVNPVSTNYPYGATVTLTAVPNAGYQFVNWSGGASGNDNPLSLVMNGSKTVIANFRVPGDDFAQRIPISGLSNSVAGSNVGATKETGEPNHAGTAGGRSVWWTWTAPFALEVTISTAGTGFPNALAVYTGTVVSNLAVVASDLGSGGPNTSQVIFNAAVGTQYHIAVDGVAVASGSITLSLSTSSLLAIISVVQLPDGTIRFDVIDDPGRTNRVEGSTNLVNWVPLTPFIQTTGSIRFIDPESTNFTHRFYRAVRQ